MRHLPALALVLLLLGCAGPAAADKKPGPDIRGVITAATIGSADQQKKGHLGSIRIEGKQEADTGYDKAQVRVTKETKIERVAGKERKPATMEDLKKGAKVQATFVGPVAESYPVMATAGEILILE